MRGVSSRRSKTWWMRVSLILILAWSEPASARHPLYRVTDLGSLGGTQSFAYAMNDKGQVVGLSRLAGDAELHAFLYSKGTMTDLSPLNSQDIITVGPTSINNAGQIASGVSVDGIYYPAIYNSKTGDIATLGSLGGVTLSGFSGVATAMNNHGQAVGYSYLDGIHRHAFLYNNGVLSDIGSFGGESFALALNDRGMIVGGSSALSNGRSHAFLYANGVMTDIDPSGDADFSRSESSAEGINNRGQVVGTFLTEDATAFHAFLYSEGVFTDLGAADSPETVASAINDHGQVVGTTWVPFHDICHDIDTGKPYPCINYKPQAFIYEHGEMTDLNMLIPSGSGWELVAAFAINNKGQIVGYGLVHGQSFRAFLLTR